jgi:hypothetical protein
VVQESGDKSEIDKKDVEEEEESEEEEVSSESDNEEIVETVTKSDVNLDDEFEKIVPFKFKRLSEESIDEADHEIAEILNEAEPLEVAIKEEKKVTQSAEEKSHEIVSEAVAEKSTVEQPVEEKQPTDTSENNEPKHIEEEVKVTPITNEAKTNETVIDEKGLPTEIIDDQKPPVPIQTYLWEDVKRSKEQVSGDNVCTSTCCASPFNSCSTVFASKFILIDYLFC